VPVHALNTLVTSLVCSRLDYCNVVFIGLPACDRQRMQSVLNAAVRLVTNASRRDRITPLFCDHHWLPIKQRIDYKLCMMVHRCLHGRTPSYLVELQSRIYPSWTQVGRVEDYGSTAHVFITWRSGIRCRSSPCVEQSAALTSCDRLC